MKTYEITYYFAYSLPNQRRIVCAKSEEEARKKIISDFGICFDNHNILEVKEI